MILLLLGVFAIRAGEIIGDSYNVTGSGSGFGLGAGANSGINPPATRLTGTAASNLRYIHTATKGTSAYSISGNKLRVTSAANPGRFVLSADGTTPFDFGPALGIGGATIFRPQTYDISISLDNDSTGTQRFSFALGTAEGDANTWDFGVQIYRTNSGNNFYVIGKRIDTTASGLAADLNAPIYTMAANSYGTEITLLMRVTDAGIETTTFHSRVQLSLNGGSTWFYDTASDPDLAGTGWRLNGTGRFFMWDVAPDAGPVTYDNFSVNLNPVPATGPETNAVIRVMTYNIHFGTDPNGVVDTQNTADFILAQGADLVALNEVDRFRARSNSRDLIAEISQKTGMAYVFSNNIPSLAGNDEYGNAILSRFPILFRDHRLLPNVGANEQRGWLKAIVEVNGKLVSFWVTHLAFVSDDTERLMCVTNFNTWIADESLPVIFCGDFNETPDKNVHPLMEKKWDDCWTVAGSGPGRTVPCPGPALYRIDYIWRAQGGPLQPTNARVPYTIEASDHFPILMDFVLTNFTNHASAFHFPCNQGSGTKVIDSTGALTGKFGANPPVWSADSPSGQPWDFSLYFNGTRRVTVPDPAQIIGTNGLTGDYTLQAWVKLPLHYSPPERMILFQYERRPGFSFSINTNRTLHTTAFKQKDVSSTASIPDDGLWHHVAVVHIDGATMKFYVDATLAATVAYTNGAGYRTSSTITLGAASEDANWFTGFLDRVGFENRALSPAQFDFPAASQTDFETWKAWYGISDPNADTDHDGQNNLAEYYAGTNPTNSASTFKILDGNRQPDGSFDLSWTAIGGKRYRVQRSDGGAAGGLPGSFSDIARDVVSETDPHPSGQPAVQTFSDGSAQTNGASLYRVRIVP